MYNLILNYHGYKIVGHYEKWYTIVELDLDFEYCSQAQTFIDKFGLALEVL